MTAHLLIASAGLYGLIALLTYASMVEITGDNADLFGGPTSRRAVIRSYWPILAAMAIAWPALFLYKAIFRFLED